MNGKLKNLETTKFIETEFSISSEAHAVFSITLDLKKAIQLEMENPELAMKAFRFSFRKWYEELLDTLNRPLAGKKEKMNAQRDVGLLEKNGIPPVTAKRGFIQSIFS